MDEYKTVQTSRFVKQSHIFLHDPSLFVVIVFDLMYNSCSGHL